MSTTIEAARPKRVGLWKRFQAANRRRRDDPYSLMIYAASRLLDPYETIEQSKDFARRCREEIALRTTALIIILLAGPPIMLYRATCYPVRAVVRAAHGLRKPLNRIWYGDEDEH